MPIIMFMAGMALLATSFVVKESLFFRVTFTLGMLLIFGSCLVWEGYYAE